MPAGGTYEPISTYTVTGSNLSGTTGVTFTSIPQTYTDLIIVQSTKVTAPAINCLRIGNGTINTNAYYSQTNLSTNGAGGSSSTRYSGNTLWISVLAHQTSDWASYVTHLPNYTDSSSYQTMLSKYNAYTYGALDAIVGMVQVTLPVDTVQCFLDRAESYVVGSMFTLYGIKAA